MRIACLQMRSGTALDDNISSFEQMVGDAANRGAEYIQSPEMTSLVEENRRALFEEIEADDTSINQNKFTKIASSLAKQYGIWLHVGSIAVRIGDNQAANRSILFSPDGTRLATYDKMHMFDVDLPNGETWRESSTYQPGAEAIVVKTDRFSLGMSICYDLRFPNLYRSLAENGANILTCPAAFTAQTGKSHWHVLLRSRAIENGAFMVAAAQGGTHQSGRKTYGHSLVINPWGEIVAELKHDNPDILFCEVDLGEVAIARNRIPNLANKAAYNTVTVTQEKNL